MHKKNKMKAIVAIAVALAFMLPTSAAFANFEETIEETIIDKISNNNIDRLQAVDDSPSTLSVTPWGWSDDIQISNVPEYSFTPEIAADSNDNMHIAWCDWRDGNREIYYTKLDNDGNTLVDDTRLTDDPADSMDLKIAVDSSNNVHIIWSEMRDVYWEIYYTKLDNDGNTLVNDTRVTYEQLSQQSTGLRPSMAADSNGNIHITWIHHASPWQIYYTKLDNNGNKLVNDTSLSDAGTSKLPAMAVDSNDNIHVIWQGNPVDAYDILYTKLDNNGNTLVNDTMVTNDPGYSTHPALAVDSNNNLHILWEDKRDIHAGIYEIYYEKLDNNGDTLVNDTRLTYGTGSFTSPALAVDSNDNIHAVFDMVCYLKLDNNGSKLVNESILSNGFKVSIALDSNDDIHLSWTKVLAGVYDIWYKRSIPVDHDLGITSIDSPVSGPASVITPEVTVENLGTFSETNIPVNMQINQMLVSNAWTEVVYNSGDPSPGHWLREDLTAGSWWMTMDTFYAATDSDVHASDVYDVGLFTPSLDLSGLSNVTLEFDMSYMYCWDDEWFEVNTHSGGSFAENLLNNSNDNDDYDDVHQTLFFDPSGYADPSDVTIEFYFNSAGSTWLFGFAIDDVVISNIAFSEDFEGETFPPADLVLILEYNETVNIDNINIGESKSVTFFPNWIPVGSGFTDYQVTACIQITDEYPYNDCMVELITLEILPFETVTNLSYRWNMVSIPFNHSIDKADFFVDHGGTYFTWADAVTAGIVADAFFGWDRTNQIYLLSDVLEPGCGYWLWAYDDCVLKVLA